jgi:glycosyltransferase 2 family protein
VTPGLRRWLRPIAGLGITIVFVLLLARQLQGADVPAAMGRMSPLWLLAALAALAAGYTLRIVRWWVMLRAMDPAVRLASCVRPFLVSIAVNNLVPFRAGDAFRVVGFRDELKAPPMRVLGTMFVERLLDLSTLLVFFFVGLSGTAPGGVPPAFVTGVAWTAAAGAALVLTLLLLAGRLEAISTAIGQWPIVRRHATVSWIAGQLHHVAGVLGVLHTPAMTARLAALSLAAWDERRPATSARSTISPRSAWSPTARRGQSPPPSPSWSIWYCGCR